jgi:hypothetical protein
MNIVFPQMPLQLREHEPIDILVTVDGKRVIVRVDWSAAASLSGGDSADAIRAHFQPRRREVERAITAHLLARGIPVSGILDIGLDELRGM